MAGIDLERLTVQEEAMHGHELGIGHGHELQQLSQLGAGVIRTFPRHRAALEGQRA